MAAKDDPAVPRESPVLLELRRLDVGSAVAVVGHPIHVMMVHFPIAFVLATLGVDVFYWWSGDPFWVRVGIWSAGIAFWTGVAASIAGTAELLLVRGIRVLEASWSHAVAAMTLVAIAGASWGLRLTDPQSILPHGLALSGLAAADDGLRRLARGQARLRSWRRHSGSAEELTKRPGPEQIRGKPVGVDVRLGEHNPDDCRDQHDIGAGQRDTGNPAKAAIRQEEPPQHEAGDDMQHRHRPDKDQLRGKPFLKRGLEKDQRGAAADSDDGGGRGYLDIDETRHPVQPVQFPAWAERPALPEHERQNNQPGRPDRDRREMNEFEEEGQRTGAAGRRLDQASQRPTPT